MLPVGVAILEKTTRPYFAFFCFFYSVALFVPEGVATLQKSNRTGKGGSGKGEPASKTVRKQAAREA